MIKKIGAIFNAFQLFLRGKKTYIAATVILLEGLGIMTEQIAALASVPEALDWLKNITLNDGLIKMAEALAIFGFRAAITRR